MDNNTEVSKFRTECQELANASYACSEVKPASQCKGKKTLSTKQFSKCTAILKTNFLILIICSFYWFQNSLMHTRIAENKNINA